jgi:hypothetical protein
MPRAHCLLCLRPPVPARPLPGPQPPEWLERVQAGTSRESGFYRPRHEEPPDAQLAVIPSAHSAATASDADHITPIALAALTTGRFDRSAGLSLR